ncbi:uncharacterized protein LOC119504584 [Choloepus didactylus]|uniref:uncharacterized protein LOC119504584 n=1 Tax=Choloepus didactylus TaxID=27675 RepID=UPI00189F76A6|nr:uncharacterized protein LOC119504584 [Choloepus didactylus]
MKMRLSLLDWFICLRLGRHHTHPCGLPDLCSTFPPQPEHGDVDEVLTNLGSSCCLIESKELKFSMELADHGLKNREEQVITLYENINLVELRLIQPYEHVITNLICEIKLQSPEMENLAIAVKRAKDKAAMQLSELEEETDQRIQSAEHKTRKEVLTNLGSSCCLIESKELKFSMELADHGLKNREEQVITLYENINLVELRLIQPYEHVITNLICEIKLQSPEMENLAIAVKRAQDKAAMQLSELEEETDQRIQAAEHKTRKEEKRKAEGALSDPRCQCEIQRSRRSAGDHKKTQKVSPSESKCNLESVILDSHVAIVTYLCEELQ